MIRPLLSLLLAIGTACTSNPGPDATPKVSILPAATDPPLEPGATPTPAPDSEEGKVLAVTDIVSEFARARLAGDVGYAEQFLSATGKESYGGDLELKGNWERFVVRDVRAADANSYEVELLLYPAGDGQPDIELLFVGPAEGAQFLIRGAEPA